MVRGSLVWVRRNPARGAEVPKTRPCVVVSRNGSQRYFFHGNGRSAVIDEGRAAERLVQPLLSAKDTRLPKDSRALCDQVRTIDKGRIRENVGVLESGLLGKLDRGLILHLELEDYVRL